MPHSAPIRRLLIELPIIAGIALVLGYVGPFGTFALSIGPRMGYWLVAGLTGYALVRPMAPLARRLAARAGLPLLVAVALVLLLPAVPMTALTLSMTEDYRAGDPVSAARLLQLYVQVWVMGVLVFGIFLLIFRRPAPEQASEAPAGHAPARPALAARLPAGFGPVLALRAEDHYVRVIGEAGSLLLLMRLGDAIAEMDGAAGLRVHRSWWVAQAAMIRLEPRGRGAVLHLVNGESAQVSRDNLARARAAIEHGGRQPG